MFMRYRGGGVGHLYMHAIEVWLAETGWGADDALTSSPEDSDISSEDGGDNKNEGSCDSHEDNSNEDSQDKLTSNEGDTSSNRTTESEDTDYSSDGDHDKLYATDGDNGETLDGEFGFTSL